MHVTRGEGENVTDGRQRNGWPTGFRSNDLTCARSPTGCSGRSARPTTRVQEAWLRLSRSDTSGVENLGGMAHDGGGARVAEHAPVASGKARRAAGRARCPTRSSARRTGTDPEQRGLDRRCRSGWPCSSCSRRSAPAERLAFVLHDMFAVSVRRDRLDHGPLARRGPAAGQPRPAPRAGPGAGSRPRPGSPAPSRRCVLRRRTDQGDFEALRGRARSGHRAPFRRRRATTG